jgi:undecaprenyl-diphosphatase
LALAELLFDNGHLDDSLQLAFLVGTLCATGLLIRRTIGAVGIGLVRALQRPSSLVTTAAGRDFLALALAQIPVAAMSLLAADVQDKLWGQPMAAAIGFLLSTLILLSTAWAMPGEQQQPTAVQALMLGLGQGLAAFPGLSLTGCTIAMAIWFGLARRRCFELTLLISMPATLAAVFRLRAVVHDPDTAMSTLLVGATLTLLVGLVSGKLLRTAVVRGQVAWFSMWVAPLAIATLAFARAWPAH